MKLITFIFLLLNFVVLIGYSQNIRVVNVTTTSITVTWDVVPGSNYYEYRIRLGSSTIQSGNINSPTNQVFPNLQPNTTYVCEVRGMISQDQPASSWSSISVKTLATSPPPPPPTCPIPNGTPYTVSTHSGLSVWPVSNGSGLLSVDWRNSPTVVANVKNTTPTGATGVALDDCGRPVFYVMHTGEDANNKLHVYSTRGDRLTTDATGLNATISDFQVVKVPNTENLWYVIYSYRYLDGTCPSGNSAYCANKLAYSTISFNYYTRSFRIISRDVLVTTNNTFVDGKAVSQMFSTPSGSYHYLYLAKRQPNINTTQFVRFKVHKGGIDCEETTAITMPANLWSLGMHRSSVELSHDGQRLALLNRNEDNGIGGQDIIVFDVSRFNSTDYSPLIIKIPDLMVDLVWNGTAIKKSIHELATTAPYNGTYSCFKHLRKKIMAIEFSPSGRYLFATGGGYSNGSGNTYNTYLLQIDLQSAGTASNKDVRIQVQQGVSVSSSTCQGVSYTAAGTNIHDMLFLQSAADGNLYFTKRNSPKLFVIPQPDFPMPQNLIASDVDLSNADYANINVPLAGSYFNIPEGIDGYDYTNPLRNQYSIGSFRFVGGLNTDLYVGQPTIFYFFDFSFWKQYFDYAISWGDGVTQKVQCGGLYNACNTHIYSKPGNYIVTISRIDREGGCIRKTWYPVVVLPCPTITNPTISHETFVCAVKFSTQSNPNYRVQYQWNFGDGTTSTERAPIHEFNPGTYTVSLNVTYYLPFCTETRSTSKSITYSVPSNPTMSQMITVPTDTREVISTSASTFSDSWPLQHTDNTLDASNPYEVGAQGVWRNDATYSYNKVRSQSAILDISKDGTFPMDQFNWKFAPFEAIPDWVKANQMTAYSPYSFELENKDALGNYSAAIYDYGGQLPVANGMNMKHNEIAFTSFEFMDNNAAGNWIFSNQTLPANTVYAIPSANKNMAFVEATLADLQNVTYVDVTVNNSQGTLNTIAFTRNEIVCKVVHPQNANWSIVVLKHAPSEGIWNGQLKIKNVVSSGFNATVDITYGHTGAKSLKVTADQAYKQDFISLVPGKSYWLNVWVSTKNVSVNTPTAGAGLGIDILAKQKNGTLISTFSFTPSGPVIEGWQQIRGTFVCPAGTDFFDIRFKKGSGTQSWYDDLRIQPEQGNMKCYVYNTTDFRLRAILDEENFASLFFYDKEGNLYLTKKETKDGIKTISENVSYMTH